MENIWKKKRNKTIWLMLICFMLLMPTLVVLSYDFVMIEVHKDVTAISAFGGFSFLFSYFGMVSGIIMFGVYDYRARKVENESSKP